MHLAQTLGGLEGTFITKSWLHNNAALCDADCVTRSSREQLLESPHVLRIDPERQFFESTAQDFGQV